MNRKNLIGLIIIILMVTSGPLYLPLVFASTQEVLKETVQPEAEPFNPLKSRPQNETDPEQTLPEIMTYTVVYNYTYTDPESNEPETVTDEPQEKTYIKYHDRKPVKKPSIKFTANKASGESPFYVTFTTQVGDTSELSGILIYKYDFDGDGANDYSCFTDQPVTHVYNVEDNVTLHPTVTVVFDNGYSKSKTIQLEVAPLNPDKWFTVKRWQYTRIGVNRNGTIYVYDEKDWIPVTLKQNGKALTNPSYTCIDEYHGQLLHETDYSYIAVNITFGLAGRAQLKFEERPKKDSSLELTETPQITLPVAKKGRLDFKPKPFEYVNSSLRVLTMDTGNHDPWVDQGITPYGEYFKENIEYVSTHTGFLTVTQTDLKIPGRGLDLVIMRVHTPPALFYGNQPASTVDYSYQDYPWAPMGKGWQLGFPWIETKSGSPTYIRFPNGQRYKYTGAGTSGTAYHSGDHFKLYSFANGNYTLYTVDGTRYDYDSGYRLKKIKDSTNNNVITFSYTSNKISTITDTIGRTVAFSYGANGQVSSITSENRTMSYSYQSGKISGYILSSVRDSNDRRTNYTYYIDYLVTKIDYPSGGNTAYSYYEYDSSGYYVYRVKSQTTFDGTGNLHIRDYSYDAGFSYLNYAVIRESASQQPIIKTIKVTYGQSSVTEEVYNGDLTAARLYKDVDTLTEERRRRNIDHYPGNNAYSVNMTQRYDNWGNLVFHKDYEEHSKHYSYANTDSSNKFVKGTGTQVYTFSGSFYSNTVKPNIHDRIVGEAELQNGAGSAYMEHYYAYNYAGLMTQKKSLLNSTWVTSNYLYDSYGNLVRSVNPENQVTNYEYGTRYSHAFPTIIKQKLSEIKNITTNFIYYAGTGNLKQVTDPLGNTTQYEYDVLGRLTKQVYPEIEGKRASKSVEYYDDIEYTLQPYKDTVTIGGTSDWCTTQTFNAEGRTWVFWYADDVLKFSSSTDQDTWSAPSSISGTEGKDHWNLFFDGTYVHMAITTGTDGQDLFYKRGNPNADGTITWGNNYMAYDTGTKRAYRPSITVTNNYVWISFERRYVVEEELVKNLHVTCSSNMNGGWTTRSGFPTLMYEYNKNQYSKLVPLRDNKVYLAWFYDVGDQSSYGHIWGYLWNGASWGTIEDIDSCTETDAFDIVSWDNNVWLFQTDGPSAYAKVRKRTYTSGTWDSGTNMFLRGSSGTSVQLSKGPNHGSLYAFWPVGGTSPGIKYSYYDGGSWTPTPLTLDTDTMADDYYGSLTASEDSYEGKISLIYFGGASPYTLIHNYLSNRHASETSVKIVNEKGKYFKRYYDGLGRLTEIERFNGSSSYSSETYSYNIFDLTDEYIDPLGNEYKFEYDALGFMKKTIYPDGSTSQNNRNYEINYDEIMDEEGRKKVLEYDFMSRLTGVKECYDASGYFTTLYTYDEVGNLMATTDSLNREISYTYDQLNRLIKVVYPDASEEKIYYDDINNLIKKIDQNNAVTHYRYDTINRLINTTYIEGIESLYTYNDNSQLTSSSYNGTILNNQYDARNRLTKESYNIYGATYGVSYAYDNCSNIVSIRYPDTSDIDLTYDDLNRVKNYGSICEIKYDKDDKILYLDYGNGITTKYMYDSRRRPVRIITDSDFYEPNWLGDWKYRKKITIQGSTAGAQQNYPLLFDIRYGFGTDSGNKLYCKNKCEPDFDDIYFTKSDGKTKLDYYIESKTNSNKALIWVKLDSIPASPNTVEIYCYYGNIFASTASNVTGMFSFYDDFEGDSMNTSKWDQDWSYGAGGTVLVEEGVIKLFTEEETISDYNGIAVASDMQFYVPYAFRARAMLERDTRIGIWKSSATPTTSYYNFAVFQEHSSTTDYTIEADGSTAVSDTKSWSVAYHTFEIRRRSNGNSDFYLDDVLIDNDHDKSSTSRAEVRIVAYTTNGISYTIEVDWLSVRKYCYPEPSISAIGSEEKWYDYTTRLLDLFIKYDDSGSVVEIQNGAVTETYGYDLLDRLTSSAGPWGSLSYSYDSVGNRLSLNRGGSVTSYTYDSMNRISSATGMSFTWDDNGNLLTWDDGSNDWDYRYDSQNRLINVEKNDAITARYTYDTGGRRVRSWDAVSGATDYVYSGLNIIDEIKAGAHEKHYYAGSMQLASNSSGTVEYYHVDHLGSTRLKTDASGSVIYSSNYEPYGPGYGESGSEEFRYTGKQEDPTGLYYFGARYYDPVTGRFITRDSVFGSLTDPQSLNRYAYCRNNPHKYTDPDGKWMHIAAGALIGGGINFAFYCMTHGDDFKANEAIATIAAGAITGGLTAATMGLTSGLAPATKIIADVAFTKSINLLGTAVDMSVSHILADDSVTIDSVEMIKESALENSMDIAVSTGFTIVEAMAPSSGVTNIIKKLKVPTQQFLQSTVSKTIASTIIKLRDNWMTNQETKYNCEYQTQRDVWW